MISVVQTAANQFPGILGDALLALMRAIGVAQASAAASPAVFGLGGLGDVTLVPGVYPGFSGLRDYHSLVVQQNAILVPAPGEVLIIRSQTSINFDGIISADGVFQQFPNLISVGSPTESGAGGGGGGGNSDTGSGFGGQFAFGFGGGQGIGYLTTPPYAIGSQGQGGPSNTDGTDGTAGAPGLVDPFFQQTTLAIYPGVTPAFTGVVPGIPGAQGAQGGNGAQGSLGNGGNGGNGGQGGNGGAGGGLVIFVAPSITFGPNATINAAGLDGQDGVDGQTGTPAAGGSNGGGGGGGGAGSGGQGGNGGVALVYYGTLSGAPTLNAPGGDGGLAALGGAGGAGDGLGLTGGKGGKGAAGPAGASGFFFTKKIV